MDRARDWWKPSLLAAVLLASVACSTVLASDLSGRFLGSLLRAPGGREDAVLLAVLVFALALCVGWGGGLARRLGEPIGLRAVLLFAALGPIFQLGGSVVARLYGWAAPLACLGLYGLLLYAGEWLARPGRKAGNDARGAATSGS